MKRFASVVWILGFAVCFCASPSFAQKDIAIDPATVKPIVVNPRITDWVTIAPFGWMGKVQKDKAYYSWINSNAFLTKFRMEEENKALRQQWKEFLGGVDVFMPYYKAREVEDLVKNKASVEVFEMKGRPEFNYKRKQVEYIFKKKF